MELLAICLGVSIIKYQIDTYEAHDKIFVEVLIPYNARYPVLLPKDHYFTHMIALECHKKSNHAAISATYNLLRQEFWIPQVKQLVRKNFKHCITCKK